MPSRYLGQSLRAALFGAIFDTVVAARPTQAPVEIAAALPQEVNKVIDALHAAPAGSQSAAHLRHIRQEPYLDASCRGYFANLLFEGSQVDKVLASFKLDRDDYGSILFHLGSDCPCALSVTPEGTGLGKRPGRFPQDYELVDQDRLHEIVPSLHLHQKLPEGISYPSPIAGVQGKIALIEHHERFYLPIEDSQAPTTHILKVSPDHDPLIANNEVALLHIAESCWTEIAQCKTKNFLVAGRSINALLSTRFDREFQVENGERQQPADCCAEQPKRYLLHATQRTGAAGHGPAGCATPTTESRRENDDALAKTDGAL